MSELENVQIVHPYVGIDGLLRLVSTAREQYLDEVVVQMKTYRRYCNDLLSSINHHDALDAYSKNEHAKNVQILTELLRKHQAFVKHYFVCDRFSDETVREMLQRFNQGDLTVPKIGTGQSPSTSDNTAEQNSGGISSRHYIPSDFVSLIVHCANEADLFVEELTAEHFTSYSAATLATPLQARSNVETVEFFDYLASKGMIQSNWQHVIDRDKLIMSSSGRRFLTKSVMSSTLCRINGKPATCRILRIMGIVDRYIEEHKVKRFQ